MRPIGFSTGALAKGEFARGLALQQEHGCAAVELSALRDHELEPLVAAVETLDLTSFRYVSVHAPSKLRSLPEQRVFELLERLPTTWPIIVHPELLRSPDLWRSLGSRLCLENMDNRKSGGRTAAEMSELFVHFPAASFCLDVGHARQIDPTMAVALTMLFEFGNRLTQVHVSDVGPQGEHMPVRKLASWAYARVARHIPPNVPLIIESVVDAADIWSEVDAVAHAFSNHSFAIGGECDISSLPGGLLVANLGGGEVRIQGRDGKWRDSDTVATPAPDPNPPRDKKH